MIQIVKAPSILGLRPTGVELLADTLLRDGLGELITPQAPLIEVNDLNHLYSTDRGDTGMINAQPLHDFSVRLKKRICEVVQGGRFPVVLGGDCSILLGIMSGLKAMGAYGLVTLDAHADFYLPTQSQTGEAADMDIALVTGRGPAILTDIGGLGPYVRDEYVIHVGQRDEEETLEYGSAQISETQIIRYGIDTVQEQGVDAVSRMVLADMGKMSVNGFWLHLDTDVLHDEENSAVDYRLPGGMRLAECESLIKAMVGSAYVKGMSVAIYNPNLDTDGHVGRSLAGMIGNVLASRTL